MSPSRRRAARRGAWLGIPRSLAARSTLVPRCGMVPRLAAGKSNRTPRPARLWGAHRDAPRKTLSVCYSPCSRALPGRRDRDIAPYRHYTRRISHAHYRTATGHALALPHRARRSCSLAVSRCAVPSCDPLRTRITRAARWGHRALPPLHTAYFSRALPRLSTLAPPRHARSTRVPLAALLATRPWRLATPPGKTLPIGNIPVRK